MYTVYWIYIEEQDDIWSQGYVGITVNLDERLRAHFKNRKTTHFTNAIKKHGKDKLKIELVATEVPLEEALFIEHFYRPEINIGWNSQKGGELGVDSTWYMDEENKKFHSKNTSIGTIAGIKAKDTSEARSKRAKLNHIKNKDSYKDISKGSNNPRAILNEGQVREIKYIHIPNGLSNTEISSIYNVKHYVISFIRTGKNWSHI